MKHLQKLVHWLPLLGLLPIGLALHQTSSKAQNQSFFYDPVVSDARFTPDRYTTISPSRLVQAEKGWEQVYDLKTDNMNRFLRATKIAIELADSEQIRSVRSAKLQLGLPSRPVGSLLFQASPPEKVANFLVLYRAAEAEGSGSSDLYELGEVTARLSLLNATDTKIRLKVLYSEGEPVSRQLYGPCTHSSGSIGVGSISGWLEPSAKPLPKITILAYLWGFELKTLVCVVLVSVCLWGGSCFFLIRGVTLPAKLYRAALSPVSAGVAFAGLALLYATIIPPLQAPDEASHLLTATTFTKMPDNREKVTLLAQRTHFERIKFRIAEKLCAADLGAPLPQGLASHVESQSQSRSPLAYVIWSVIGKPLLPRDSGHALLLFRVFNGLFLGALLMGASWLFHRSSPGPAGLWVVPPFLLAPSVFFFGTALSNYPFLMGGFFLQALAFSMLWQASDSEAGSRVGVGAALLAGLGTGVAITAGDGGFVSLLWWSFLLPGSVLATGRLISAKSALMKQALAMGGLFGFGILAVALPGAFLNGGNGFLSPRLQSYFSLWKVPLAQSCSPLLFGYLAVGFFSAGLMIVIYLCLCIRNRLPQRILNQSGVVLAGILLLVLILGVLCCGRPRLPNHQDMPFGAVPSGLFLLRLGQTFLSGFFFPKPDWYAVRYFWGYFGWLETPLPTLLTDSLRYFFGVGLALLPSILLFQPSLRPKAWLWIASWLAILGSLAVIGVMGLVGRGQVHGRYLIGVYILAMMLSSQGYQYLACRWVGYQRLRQFFAVGILTAIALVHGWALNAVLDRYF